MTDMKSIQSDFFDGKEVFVLPKNTIGDNGYLWESDLLHAGWNDLADDKKKGKITCLYKGFQADVKFECLDKPCAVYLDEVIRI